MQDEQIVSDVISGNVNAFELLILKYQSRIFNTVLNIVKRREVAEDIVQDTFMKAYEKLSSLNNRETFYPWIKRIAINLSLNTFEREKRVLDVEREDNDYSFFEQIAGGEAPEETALREELRKYVRMFVDSLPDKLRVVIVMREIEDMSYEEISEIMNIPLGTVRSRLFNARTYIKERLIKQGLADGLYESS